MKSRTGINDRRSIDSESGTRSSKSDFEAVLRNATLRFDICFCPSQGVGWTFAIALSISRGETSKVIETPSRRYLGHSCFVIRGHQVFSHPG